jgi:hypothetical protein
MVREEVSRDPTTGRLIACVHRGQYYDLHGPLVPFLKLKFVLYYAQWRLNYI